MIKNSLRSLARRFLTEESREAIRRWGYQSMAPFLWGRGVVCPICKGHFRRFRIYVEGGLDHSIMCPWCLSLERHRLLWLYLQQHTDIFAKNLSLLHIAPEYFPAKEFTASANIRYVPAGLRAPYIKVELDILQIPFPDNCFEVVICYHVLDRILDDVQAMREMHRVLKPGGLVFPQSPIDDRRDTTFEDPTCVTPEDRERLFGKSYHVRIYGLDFKDRLAEAGFSVRLDHFVDTLSPETIERYGLTGEGVLYICTK